MTTTDIPRTPDGISTYCRVYPDRQSWEQARRHSIGASEAFSVLSGKGAAEVWLRKTHPDRAESPISEYDADVSHAVEPVLAKHFAQQTGAEVIDPGDYAVWYDPELPIMTATPDRFAVWDGEVGVVDFKHITRWMLERQSSPMSGWDDGTPFKHVVQIEQQMHVAGLRVGWAFAGTKDCWPNYTVGPRRIEQNERLRDLIRDKLSTWWDKYVKTDTPPPERADPTFERVMKALYPQPEPARVFTVPDNLSRLAERWDRHATRRKRAQDALDGVKREVIALDPKAEVFEDAAGAKLWTFKAGKKGRTFRRSGRVGS